MEEKVRGIEEGEMEPIVNISVFVLFAIWLWCCAYALETDRRDVAIDPDASTEIASTSSRGW